MRKLIYILLLILPMVLTSCKKTEDTPSEEILDTTAYPAEVNYRRAEIYPLTDLIEQSPVDIILRETASERKALEFAEYGIIKGTQKIMVPVSTYARDGFVELGIKVQVSVDGQHATLTKGDNVVDFDANFLTAYLNNVPKQLLIDMPFYHNGIMYIPFESALDLFEIPYEYEENKLIIGKVEV